MKHPPTTSNEADRQPEGTVHVGGFPTALGTFVVPALQQLAVSDPALQVQVVEVDVDVGAQLPRAHELDLLRSERFADAIAPGRGPHPGLVEDDLRRGPFRIVVPLRRKNGPPGPEANL